LSVSREPWVRIPPPFLKRRSANPSTKENKTNEWRDLRDRTQNESIADFTISLCLIREFFPIRTLFLCYC